MTNAFWLFLYVVLAAAIGGAGYYIGHERGAEQGREEAALPPEDSAYFDASVAKLVQLGFTWDGSGWDGPGPVNVASQVNAAATALPDRTSCAEIQGTPYRSPAERDYYFESCLGRTVTPTPACGEPPNPWCYDLFPGTLISSPPGEFCSYFDCADNFWAGTGYVIRCRDGAFSKTGGNQDACSEHDGVLQPLYAH
jgi:hypothetical protein